jgi:hypothetical protein
MLTDRYWQLLAFVILALVPLLLEATSAPLEHHQRLVLKSSELCPTAPSDTSDSPETQATY